MNAWTNLRLATIQADLATRRAEAAAERSVRRITRTGERVRPANSHHTDPQVARWPLSTASRS